MDVDDPEFQKELLETFKQESSEHIQNITNLLVELEKDFEAAATDEKLETIYREAHSLKGSARAVGLDVIQNICQLFENALSALKERTLEASKDFFQLCFEVLDYVSELVQTPGDNVNSPEKYNTYTDRLNAIIGEKKVEEKPLEDKPPEEAAVEEQKPPEEAAVEEQKPPPAQVEPIEEQKLLKVAADKLDSIIVQMEELLPIKLRYNALNKSLLALLQSIGKEQVFEEVRNALGEIQKGVSEDRHTIESLIGHLLEESKKLLLQPFSTLLLSFPRMVRDISNQLGKEIEFSISGDSVEIDRRILEGLKDPLLHLVRNSIDHGIELPDEREKRGKSREGKIEIAIEQVGGNEIRMLIKDDGAGFPLEKIKENALKNGVVTEEQLESFDTEKVIELAFQSGISSAEMITEISGRGVGLGVLSENMEKLGCRFDVDTEEGRGTTMILSLPLTIATFRGVHIDSGEQQFIIPSQNIGLILRKGSYEFSTIENQRVIFFKEKNYAYRHLSELLELPVECDEDPRHVILVSSGMIDMAIGADQIFGEEEVFVKSLGDQLKDLVCVAAGTILDGKRVVPILDIRGLLEVAKNRTASGPKVSREGETISAKKRVLIAEDTSTTRLLFKSIFENAGFDVETAADGAEALEKLLQGSFDLLISDLEMPRLNGMELIEKVKGDEKTKDLPIVIITGKESSEDKRRGLELGVDAYIEKSKFVQKEILSIAERLI
ncbi:MAG: response regulator [Simkaniaceae bacterium]|nr:response regulator [Simkaniaceae bacterium]